MHSVGTSLACCVILAGSALAQVGARGMMGAPHFSGSAGGIRAGPTRSLIGFPSRDSQHFRHPGGLWLGSPFWWDDGYGSSAPPQIIVLQDNPAKAPEPSMHWEDAPKPVAPLLIELQGDRYVRVSGGEESTAALAEAPMSASAASQRIASTALVPSVFVFRDGHREESGDYSIVSGVIYARGDYWTQGAWTKPIPIESLDLPATFAANRERGVEFVLPSAPNEVVTRP